MSYRTMVGRAANLAQPTKKSKALSRKTQLLSNKLEIDGTPYDGKLSRTVWSGGKSGDNIKGLPITIIAR